MRSGTIALAFVFQTALTHAIFWTVTSIVCIFHLASSKLQHYSFLFLDLMFLIQHVWLCVRFMSYWSYCRKRKIKKLICKQFFSLTHRSKIKHFDFVFAQELHKATDTPCIKLFLSSPTAYSIFEAVDNSPNLSNISWCWKGNKNVDNLNSVQQNT